MEGMRTMEVDVPAGHWEVTVTVRGTDHVVRPAALSSGLTQEQAEWCAKGWLAAKLGAPVRDMRVTRVVCVETEVRRVVQNVT